MMSVSRGYLRTFRLRAECEADLRMLLRMLGGVVRRAVWVRCGFFPDVVAELECVDMDVSSLRAWCDKVPDGHVMRQTVAMAEEFTAERDYDS